MQSTQYKDWKRGLLQDVLVEVLEPLRKVMEDGINLLCPDGNRRLCFPVLAAYIADYEEQRSLASVLMGYCVKCTIPSYRSRTEPIGSDNSGAPSSVNKATSRKHPRTSGRDPNGSTKRIRITLESSGDENITYESRTGEECKRLRSFYADDVSHLKSCGLHPTSPFTERHVYSSIYDALAPDLLHQVQKCLYDYIYDWTVRVIDTTSTVAGLAKVKGEIDARFSQLPPYPELRHFRDGISSTTRWTGNEYKNMAKSLLGVVKDLIPKPMTKLIKLYLDILRLSLYVSHDESTLQLLEDTVKSFIRLRNDPNGPLVKNHILPAGWYCPKFHMFLHYPQWVRSKGPLPYSSTEHSEGCHQMLKRKYRASNKGPQAIDFMLKQERRIHGFSCYDFLLSKEDEPTVETGELPPTQEKSSMRT